MRSSIAIYLASTISPRFDEIEAIPVPSKRRGFEGRLPCVILPRRKPDGSNCFDYRGGRGSIAEPVAADIGAIKMTRERSPLWVWITVVLLALGALIYVVVFYAAEYLMTFF